MILLMHLANKLCKMLLAMQSSSLPVLGDLVTLLDSLRMDALQAKTQERVLLAALVSRRGNMSESFSNAYVSSIIRAGEAVGHEEVCEIAQDEECRASTMLPFDFFCDNKGVWEEPCRPLTGYHSNVAGDELKKRAHARAVIQKSVRRMQSRLGLKGGISDGGPYFTVTPSSTPAPSPTAVSTPNPATLVRSSSSSLKRKGSQIIDPSLVSGIGVSGIPETLFNPGHISAPMIWDFDSSSNSPYGRHVVGLRPSIVSVGGHLFNENKRRKTSEILSQGDSLDIGQRSTHEVKWEDVAKMFLNGGSSRSIVTKQIDFGSKQQKEKKEIFAPFIRSVDNSFFDADNDQGNEVSSEEDISDETILRRHQEVLDGMKRKLDAALEKRQQQPQQRVRKK